MVEFKRKKGENFESFLRKFNRSLIRSRKLRTIRGRQYLIPKRNKNRQKEHALVSMKLRAQKEYLKKIGKLKEEERKQW